MTSQSECLKQIYAEVVSKDPAQKVFLRKPTLLCAVPSPYPVPRLHFEGTQLFQTTKRYCWSNGCDFDNRKCVCDALEVAFNEPIEP